MTVSLIAVAGQEVVGPKPHMHRQNALGVRFKCFWVREGLKQPPPRGSVTTTLLVHGTILVRQALEKDGS